MQNFRPPKKHTSEACLVRTVKHGRKIWCFGIRTKNTYLKSCKMMHCYQEVALLLNILHSSTINDPKRRAKECWDFLEKKAAEEVSLMICPPQTLHITYWVATEWAGRKSESTITTECLTAMGIHAWEAWQQIDPSYLEKLISRIPRICKAVREHIEKKTIN